MSTQSIITWLLGFIATVLLFAVATYVTSSNSQFSSIENRLDGLTTHQGEVLERLRQLDTQTTRLLQELSDVGKNWPNWQIRLAILESSTMELVRRIQDLTNETRSLRQILEHRQVTYPE